MSPAVTRLHLIRHGRVAAPWPERVYGQLDVPLSDAGRDDARRAAERLSARPLSGVWSSGLARAAYGAEQLCVGRDLAPGVEARLVEIDRGRWAGRSFAEIERDEPGELARWSADPGGVRSPGGESLTDVAARTLAALDELSARHPGEELAIVAHSWVIRVTVCHTLGLALVAAPRLDLPPGSLTTVDWPAAAGAAAERSGGLEPSERAAAPADPNRPVGRWAGRMAVLVGLNLERAPER